MNKFKTLIVAVLAILAYAGIMLMLGLLLSAKGAQAADVAKPVVKATPIASPVVAQSPFYIGAWGGLGMSNTINQFTLPGVQGFTGDNSVFAVGGWPTGIIAGAEFGYLNTSGSIIYGAHIDVGYDFEQGCIGAQCPTQRKQSWIFMEGVEFGISPTTLLGFVPSTVQPSNWAVPINVPANLSSNLILLVDAGYAERTLGLCGIVDQFNDLSCGNQIIAAPYAGLDLKLMASGSWEVAAKWDHIFWGNQYSWTTSGAAPNNQPFVNPTQIKSENLFTIGLNYHLPAGSFFGL